FKIKARAHIQNIGLKDFGYIKHDTVIGTTGKGLHLEAIELIAEGLKGKEATSTSTHSGYWLDSLDIRHDRHNRNE
ncbi:hypothetical protein EVA_20197, partial [gut metagenome]